MYKILVPVDFSKTSIHALNFALNLFRGEACEITVLHSYEIPKSAFTMKSIDRYVQEDADRAMDALIKKTQEEEPGMSFKSHIIKGLASKTVTTMCNKGSYDFVVMGTKGASGLKKVFLGSVAGNVITRAKTPVIVVPADYDNGPLKEIVIAVSSVPILDANVVEPLKTLVKLSKAKTNILHISDDQKADLSAIENALHDLNPTVTHAFGTSNINAHLNEYLEKEGASMLCLIRGKKDFFQRIFNESVTLKQTFNSSAPLLILHN